jgi:sigma-B regulation protein RsbU (phosphoserine phosphatase)
MEINRDLQATSHIIRWLERSSDSSDHLIDNIPGVFAILATDGQVLRTNRNFAKQAGISFEVAIRENLFGIIESIDGTPLKTFFNQLAAEINLKFEGRFKSDIANARHFQFDFSVFNSEMANAKTFVILHGQDVTDIKKMSYENARMNSELDFAKQIQFSLLPPDYFEANGYQVAGYLLPATECAGDWWHYSQHENRLIVWLGDVVGHGAASALLTSAVNSAVTILESGEQPSIATILSRLNLLIHQTTKGRQCMTMQVFDIDLESGRCRVSSASHPEPIKISRYKGVENEKFVSLIHTLPCAMLGLNKDASFTESEFQLQPGEKIFIFTDGVSELRNESGAMLGGRRLIKILERIGKSPEAGLRNFREDFLNEINAFRGSAILEDDLTFVTIQRNP